MKRAQWIVDNYGTRLVVQARADDTAETAGGVDAAALVEGLIEADPSPNKAYSTWLAATYARDGFLWEDLPKATETLALFHRWRRRLPADQRDIGRHATLAELWSVVESFKHSEEPVSQNDVERRERDAVYAESRFIYQNGDLIIVSPQTVRAAKWWGRGTRWCTSAENNNRFATYHKNGDLVVMVHGQRKWQFHAASEVICDSKDAKRAIEWWHVLYGELLRSHAPALFTAMFPNDPNASHYAEACEVYGLKISRVPFVHLTTDICLAAVRRNPKQMDLIPGPILIDLKRDLMSPLGEDDEVSLNPDFLPVLLETVRRDKTYLDVFVPGGRSHHKTWQTVIEKTGIAIDLCRAAVEADPTAFTLVPEPLRHAVSDLVHVDRLNQRFLGELQENPSAIRSIPARMQTVAMWESALVAAARQSAESGDNPLSGMTIPPVLVKTFDEANWERLAAAGAFDIDVVDPNDMPIAYPSPVIRAAVERFLSRNAWDDEIFLPRNVWENQTEGSPSVWSDLLQELRTIPRVIEQLRKHRHYVPYAVRDHLKAMPSNAWTSELAGLCVRADVDLLPIIPPALRTARLCYRAALGRLDNLDHAPVSVLTQKVLTGLAERELGLKGPRRSEPDKPLRRLADADARALADAAARSGVDLPEPVWIAIVSADGRLLLRTPPQARTPAVLRAALDAGALITDIPADMLDEELCLRAIRPDGASSGTARLSRSDLAHVPERLRTEVVCLAALSQDAQRAWPHIPETLRDNQAFLRKALATGDALDHLPPGACEAE